MCGIVGYIGDKKATPILINGLLRLEYRGYDSAGIAVMEENNIVVKKDKGRVNNLYNLEGIDSLNGTIGIAHTRWATHGKPSKENSHPHMDNSDSFAVVHNGIIENYHELKKFLIDKGYKFLSQTDTEVIPNLIHYYYAKENDVLKAIQYACNDLKGSYAIEILTKYESNKMFVVRKDSPLVIGKGSGENYISSDIPAILSYTKDFYLLDDNEIVELSKDNVIFYDKDLNKINKQIKSIEWGAASAEKDGYEDFMLKEINEQPNAIRETIGAKLDNGHIEMEDLNFTKEYLESLNKIYIVACGTAMHAGLVAKTIFEKLCKIPVEVDIASEFRYRDPIINDKTLAIYISQSGETADTLAALRLARENGGRTLSIVNVKGSSIARESDYVLYTHAGPEIAVASTKAYTAQLAGLYLITLRFALAHGKLSKEAVSTYLEQLLTIPSMVEHTLSLEGDIDQISKSFDAVEDLFFIGRGLDYALSCEGSIKLKEISYIHSEAYAAGELKHGTLSLITDKVPVIALATQPDVYSKMISNIREVKARGANVILVAYHDAEVEESIYDYLIRIPEVPAELAPFAAAIVLQEFAYYTSYHRGLNVDQPRNLAKSVTVE